MRATPRGVLIALALTMVLSCGKKDENNTSNNSNNAQDMAMEDTGGSNNGGDTGVNNGDDTGVNNATDMGGDDMTAQDMGVDMAPEGDYLALIIATLADPDLAASQAAHDPIAMGGEAPGKALGDFGHKVMLGTTLLGSTQDEFLGIDRWTSLTGAMTLYTNPQFVMGFSALFNPVPVPVMYEHRPDWYEWGDFNVADAADPHYFVVVRGTLASADSATAQGTHDAIAMGGEAGATAAGDMGHLVYLSVENPQDFLAIDIWSDMTNLETTYMDAQFQAAFATLFDANGVTIGVYQSTDWYQW